MAFSILTLARAAFGRPPKLLCSSDVWQFGVAELRKRTKGGRRESGAFLLGQKGIRTRRILEFLYYDDIDPTCLRNGIVELNGRKLGAVWQRCSDVRLDVVADIHVHPRGHRQSSSDQDNPMIAEIGHLALILPDFAARKTNPGAIGIHEYRGARNWIEHSHKGHFYFHVGWWPK